MLNDTRHLYLHTPNKPPTKITPNNQLFNTSYFPSTPVSPAPRSPLSVQPSSVDLSDALHITLSHIFLNVSVLYAELTTSRSHNFYHISQHNTNIFLQSISQFF
jgi:hypothetical protein